MWGTLGASPKPPVALSKRLTKSLKASSQRFLVQPAPFRRLHEMAEPLHVLLSCAEQFCTMGIPELPHLRHEVHEARWPYLPSFGI